MLHLFHWHEPGRWRNHNDWTVYCGWFYLSFEFKYFLEPGCWMLSNIGNPFFGTFWWHFVVGFVIISGKSSWVFLGIRNIHGSYKYRCTIQIQILDPLEAYVDNRQRMEEVFRNNFLRKCNSDLQGLQCLCCRNRFLLRHIPSIREVGFQEIDHIICLWWALLDIVRSMSSQRD